MATWVPWTASGPIISSSTTCFAGNLAGTAVIAGASDGLYRNAPGTSLVTWNTSSGIGTRTITGVASTNGGEVMFATTSSSVYYSIDSGASWTSMVISGGAPATISCIACGINTGTVTVVFGVNNGTTFSTTNTTPSTYTIWSDFAPTTAFSGTSPPDTALCTSIASDTLGTHWVLTISDGAGTPVGATSGIYHSTDGATWGSALIGPGSRTYTSVACSSDSSTFIACSSGTGGNTLGAVLIGTTNGTAWAALGGAPALPYKYVRLNKNGTKLYTCAGTSGLYYSLDGGVNWTKDTTTPPSPATQVNAVYVNSTLAKDGLPWFIGVTSPSASDPFIYYAGYNPTITPICFKEGSKILCFVDGKEEYLPVETLKPGTFVKTYLHGYKAIDMIGHSKLYNPAHTLRGKNRLYVCKKTKYPEITEDLVVTGCHSILVDSVTEQQYKDIEEFAGRIYVTDKLCRFPACLDDRAEPYTEEGVHTIWHFALTHNDYYMNYGVYANGLLVETTSKRMMKDLSGMELV